MNSPAGELQDILGQARQLDGWTVTWLETGAFRVTSPQGITIVPATTSVTEDFVLKVLEDLSALGLEQSTRLQPGRTQARLDAAKIAAAATTIPDFIAPVAPTDHKDIPAMASKTEDGILRLTVRQASPDVTRNGGQRYERKAVLITPQIAEAFAELIDPDHNRNERPANTARFKRIILEKRFLHTHQGMAFNVLGRNSDGRHRILGFLAALAEDPTLAEDESRWPVVDITYNMPVETAFGFDGGAGRSAKDHAAVAGIEKPGTVTPLVQLLHKYNEGAHKPQAWRDIPALLPAEIPVLCNEFGPALLEAYLTVRSTFSRRIKIHLNSAAVFYYLAKRDWDGRDAEGRMWSRKVDGKRVELHPVDDFIDAVAEDTRRPRKSPQRALNNWLLAAANDQRKDARNPQTHLAMYIIAYNEFIDGDERLVMKWAPSKGIPSPHKP